MGVDVEECLDRGQTFGRLVSTDQDTVGIFKVLDGGPFGEEFGVGENLEFSLGGAVLENGFDRRSSADREGGFLHDDFIGGGNLGDFPCAEFDVF